MGKKKNNLKDLSQSHGKEEKFVPSTLDQIWGDEGLSKYGTLDEKEYEEQIENMMRTDLWGHASKLGLVPIDNLNLLRRTLMTEFRRYAVAYRKPPEDKKPEPKLSKEALKILAEGK